MHGVAVYVKEELSLGWDLSLEISVDSHLCFLLALLHLTSYFVFLYQSPSVSLCTVFDAISSNIVEVLMVCIGVSTSPQNPPPLYYCVFMTPSPLKVQFFSEAPKYYSFSSLTPSCLLKITKFLVKISQFEFLVMTEKNIFVYKLFFVIKYFRF